MFGPKRHWLEFMFYYSDSLMVKKNTKLFALLKFGSLRGSTSASLKIGEILAVCKNLVFETRGLTHVTLLIVTVCLLAPRLRALAKRVNPLICQVVYRANHKCKYFSTTFSSTNQTFSCIPA